jgi:Skp family chaperone for outer membrane proteins
MSGKNKDDLINGTKLSIIGLLKKVSIPHIVVSVSFLLGIGFVAGKLYAAYIEKTNASTTAEQVHKAEEKSKGLEEKIRQCQSALENAQMQLKDAYSNQKANDRGSNRLLKELQQSHEAEKRIWAERNEQDRKAASETLAKVQAELSTYVARPCFPLDRFYVDVLPGKFSVARCFADTMAAAPKIGFSATRFENEVQLEGAVGSSCNFVFTFLLHTTEFGTQINKLYVNLYRDSPETQYKKNVEVQKLSLVHNFVTPRRY